MGEQGLERWGALGSSVVLRVTDRSALARARAAVERELHEIDLACSRFRADSELVRLNARAGARARVSPLLAEALALALRAAELTGGDVDPTVGRALELAGYDRDWSELASAALAAPELAGADPAGPELAGAAAAEAALGTLAGAPRAVPRLRLRTRAGWRVVELDRASSTVLVPRGIALDLGATAKAWAADRAAAAAARAGGCAALVSLGGDIATSGTAPSGGWRIFVTDDHRSDTSAEGQMVTIASGALATSSTAVRRWSHGGRVRHHIIDPRSGEPARSAWRTASVAAASCADANIASTAAIVKDGDAPAWLERRGLPSRLVAWDGTVANVAGWPR